MKPEKHMLQVLSHSIAVLPIPSLVEAPFEGCPFRENLNRRADASANPLVDYPGRNGNGCFITFHCDITAPGLLVTPVKSLPSEQGAPCPIRSSESRSYVRSSCAGCCRCEDHVITLFA